MKHTWFRVIFIKGFPNTLAIKFYLSRHVYICPFFCFNCSIKGAHRQGATIVSPHGTTVPSEGRWYNSKSSHHCDSIVFLPCMVAYCIRSRITIHIPKRKSAPSYCKMWNRIYEIGHTSSLTYSSRNEIIQNFNYRRL